MISAKFALSIEFRTVFVRTVSSDLFISGQSDCSLVISCSCPVFRMVARFEMFGLFRYSAVRQVFGDLARTVEQQAPCNADPVYDRTDSVPVRLK